MTSLRRLEEKWRKKWETARIFEADPDQTRKKFFITFPFPYMNGPLHVGHGESYEKLLSGGVWVSLEYSGCLPLLSPLFLKLP